MGNGVFYLSDLIPKWRIMSIKLMSAIFETEFIKDFDYEKNGEKRTAKASTAKLVLLAIADHCNDDGQAYPGLSRLEVKTALSRQGICDTIDALKYNGILSVIGTNEKNNTNTYKINMECFNSGVVKPLDQGSQATLLEVVKPLDLNHQLTINNHHNDNLEIGKPKPEKRKSKYKLSQQDLDNSDLIVKAEWVHSKMARDKENTLLPEQYHQQASWFQQYTGLSYLPKFQSLWISGFEEWNSLGVVEEDVMKATQKLQNAGLSIISPGSLTKTLNSIVANRKKKPDTYNPWS